MRSNRGLLICEFLKFLPLALSHFASILLYNTSGQKHKSNHMHDFLQPSRPITFGFKKLEVWGVIEGSCYASFSHSFFWRRLILHRSCFETFLVENSRVFARRFFWNLHTLSLLFKKLEDKFFSSFSNYYLLSRHILHCF